MNERNEKPCFISRKSTVKKKTFVLSVKKLFASKTKFNPHVKTVHEETKNTFEFFSGKLF